MFTDIDFAMFFGRPWRHVSPKTSFLASRWTCWRDHPCAELVQAMLDERGLDELDVLIVESGASLAVETPLDVRFFAVDDNTEERASELAGLAGDLDYTVAWRVRDLMIQAALEAVGLPDWVLESGPPATGRLAMIPSRLDWATPTWAMTGSTPLLRQLERFGMGVRETLAAIHDAQLLGPTGRGPTFADAANVLVTLEGGRLHCTCHGNGAGMVKDLHGLDLLVPEQHLPDVVMAAAAGRRLSQITDLSSPPPLLRGTDPVVQKMDDYEAPSSGIDPCTRIRLEATTETLADIPLVALDAVGVRGPVPRDVKPWLASGLRADGSKRA